MYYAKRAGLLPRIERTGVAEYGRSISTKAVWSDRKAKNAADKGLTTAVGSDTTKKNKLISGR